MEFYHLLCVWFDNGTNIHVKIRINNDKYVDWKYLMNMANTDF
jgi:hypothetical protein